MVEKNTEMFAFQNLNFVQFLLEYLNKVQFSYLLILDYYY